MGPENIWAYFTLFHQSLIFVGNVWTHTATWWSIRYEAEVFKDQDIVGSSWRFDAILGRLSNGFHAEWLAHLLENSLLDGKMELGLSENAVDSNWSPWKNEIYMHVVFTCFHLLQLKVSQVSHHFRTNPWFYDPWPCQDQLQRLGALPRPQRPAMDRLPRSGWVLQPGYPVLRRRWSNWVYGATWGLAYDWV